MKATAVLYVNLMVSERVGLMSEEVFKYLFYKSPDVSLTLGAEMFLSLT